MNLPKVTDEGYINFIIATPRPFRAWFYPFAPLLMLVFAVLLFFGYIYSNPFPSLYALGVLAISYPVFRMIKN